MWVSLFIRITGHFTVHIMFKYPLMSAILCPNQKTNRTKLVSLYFNLLPVKSSSTFQFCRQAQSWQNILLIGFEFLSSQLFTVIYTCSISYLQRYLDTLPTGKKTDEWRQVLSSWRPQWCQAEMQGTKFSVDTANLECENARLGPCFLFTPINDVFISLSDTPHSYNFR